jgi:hypothetical protein
MMQIAERAKSLAPEQYGSRKDHRAIDLAVNKTLTSNILHQLKRTGAICSNNTKSCYNLIGHTQASLAMQQVGVPKSFVDCLFTTLQQGVHKVHTWYGDSEATYSGTDILIPIHGIYQGNGVGPAIWAVVSSPLLELMHSKGFGFLLFAPVSKTEIRFVGYAFVDDTDLIQILDASKTSEQVWQELQRASDTREAALSSTCGAIAPEKTHWCLIDFTWHNGYWRYKTNEECPGSLHAFYIHADRKQLKHIPVSKAAETLGVHLAANSDTSAQMLHLETKVREWVDKMKAGVLTRQEMWVALQSTIWRTLLYPLPATNLSKKQCKKIMSILLQFALPTLGICHSFP